MEPALTLGLPRLTLAPIDLHEVVVEHGTSHLGEPRWTEFAAHLWEMMTHAR